MADRDFILGLDLDGCVADFYGGLRPIAAEWLGVPLESLPDRVSYGLPEWGVAEAPGGYPALHRFAVTQRDLFRRLEPMPRAPQVIRRLSEAGVNIRIITHRLFISRSHQAAVEQTVEWLDRHDIPYYGLCFVGDKEDVGADLYVEDTPRNVEALRSRGRRVIVYANSTNLGLDGPRTSDWEEIGDLVLAARDG
ncbi:MAG: 5'-nucleotidase [Planctomycetota bacterium]|nr:MAG: 5'-nucleotidase [Planctomycetota bacterium]